MHAIAALCSNGVFFAQQFVGIGIILSVIEKGTLWERISVGLFYTVFTVIGSVAMHYVSSNFIEKGKRKVGA